MVDVRKGFTIWFTGLSASGKSTVAQGVHKFLAEKGYFVEVLDGDEVRKELNYDLGFSKEDRDTNIKRISFLTKILSRNGVVAVGAAISPYRELRQYARSLNKRFCEVYVDCPLEECIKRDPKGMYKKALAGEIKNFTGIDDPYEAPEKPELILETHRETPEESARRVIDKLVELKFM
ncbi:MAG: adenylyl-sulfate kinase [Candidatus Micrarchaeota archaeon]